MMSLQVSNGDRWYVTDGVVAVGPVEFDLLARGVAHGRIPSGSLVRHESWKVWRRLEDVEGLSDEDLKSAVEHFADISARADERASGPNSIPPPPPSDDELQDTSQVREQMLSHPSQRPPAVNPVGVLASAETLDEALLLGLSTSVTAAAATVGFLHRWRDDLQALVTDYAQGPDAELLLGERLLDEDAAMGAAHAGVTIMGEPRLGEAGRYIAGRVSRCIGTARGVAMVPLHLDGALIAMIELGREARAFRAREIARVEDVVEALAARIVVAGWLG